MGKKEKVGESEKSDMEEGEVETHSDEEMGVEEDDEEDEEEEETTGTGGGGGAEGDGGEEEDESDGEGVADSEKKEMARAAADGAAGKKKSKTIEAEIAAAAAAAAEREVSKGGGANNNSSPSQNKKTVKEEPRETPVEERKGSEDGKKKKEENERDGKWKGDSPLVVLMKAAKRQSLEDAEATGKSETEGDVEEEGEEQEQEQVERAGENHHRNNHDDEEKSEEEERKEAEKDLALTMSSSWAPLSERERESLKVSKSGRDEREIESYRENQSEAFKERGRTREDDGELSKDKSRPKKQKLSDPPILSLSLPDTSLHLASSDPGPPLKSKSKSSAPPCPKASENERSFRSFGPTQSQSNGYTNSLSLSLSHPFFHNASCSLTQNSFDDKEGTTCSSRQISVLKDDPNEGTRGSSFGVREQFFHMASEGSHDRSKHRRELPLYHRMMQSGNPQFLQGGGGGGGGNTAGNGEGTRDSSRSFMDERPTESLGNNNHHPRGNEGSQGGHSQGSDHYGWKEEGSLVSGGMERSRNFNDRNWNVHKDSRHRQQQEDWSSANRSANFQLRRYEAHKSLDRERRPDADPGRDLSLSGSRGFVERDEESAGPDKGVMVVEADSAGGKNLRKVERTWLHEIVTEPIQEMAQRLQDLPDSFLESLKKCLQDTLGSSKRKDEFVSLQKTLQRRSNLTTETLLLSHRIQLEILVALKTGIPAFLHPEIPLSTSALIEIFLGTRCRNVACQSQLPADDCECKVCSTKPGFCNACMCVVCSKFDFDANTCRWIGCDFCLHWCHSDCGIHMGHIASGISTRGTSSESVMQFRCIGCGHTSELYGFVKDVFTTCAKEWSSEILAGELQCVRRIFHRSEDLRGKQLFGKAEQLLVKLESSRDVDHVCQSMLKFFAAGEKDTPAACTGGADGVRDAIPVPREREMTNRLADAVRDAIHVIKAPNGDGTDLEKARAALKYFDNEVESKRQEAAGLHQERAWQKSQIEELESIVQIKQTEAKMLQMRADETRREAEGLQRIVQAKTDKIEEEYKVKIIKLRLNEAEEKRRKWFDEVQTMEKAHREYSAMKMSMVSDIRELLKKIEPAKSQL